MSICIRYFLLAENV
jgi:hypothetical protein